jgi:hypothetical protein
LVELGELAVDEELFVSFLRAVDICKLPIELPQRRAGGVGAVFVC